MLSPVQNQDMLQRSDVLSSMRTLETAKVLGDMHRSAQEMRRWERQMGQAVQEQEGSQGINPDAGSGRREDQRRHAQDDGEDESPEPADEHPHPLYMEGGDVLDIVA
jgi:hypothetical protein